MKTEVLFGAPCVLDEGIQKKSMTFVKYAKAKFLPLTKSLPFQLFMWLKFISTYVFKNEKCQQANKQSCYLIQTYIYNNLL